MSGIYFSGAGGKAAAGAAYAPKTFSVPVGDFTDFPLAVANIDKFFTVAKSCGTNAYVQPDIEITEYVTLLFGVQGWSITGTDATYNSAAQNTSYNNTSGAAVSLSGSIFIKQDCNVSVSFSGSTQNIKVAGSQSDTTTDGTWSGDLRDGDVISWTCTVEAGNTCIMSVSVTDETLVEDDGTPGTPDDFIVSDADDGGLKIVPGIFGERLTWCRIALTAKATMTNVIIYGEYHTEDAFDVISMTVRGKSVLSGVGGDADFAKLWSGALSAGDKIAIEYSKDLSFDNAREAETFFEIKSDPVRVGVVTGYEDKLAAAPADIYIGGADGKAIKIT